MRSEWAPKGELEHILAGLSPENRLACEISLSTGLRINDVLALTPAKVKKQRFTTLLLFSINIKITFYPSA